MFELSRASGWYLKRLKELPGRVRGLWAALAWRKDRWSTLIRAHLKRRRLNSVTFIGITGSAGKTAAKDLSAAVLAVLGPCQRNKLTTNEHVGVAETVLHTTPAHRFSVVEVSAHVPGYIDRSLRLVQPRIGVLTLVARDHIKSYKSVEAIAAEKGKLIEALPPDGVAVMNIDDPLVRAIGERCGRRVIWFGEGEGATLRLRSVRSRYPEPLTLSVDYAGRTYEVVTALHGTHLAIAVLAALGVGLAAGVPLEAAIAALPQAPFAPGRMQIMHADGGVVFLRDDWKAPQWQFDAPFAFMREAQAARKVFVIGTISSSSLSSSKLYPKIARQALEIGELVVFVGPHALRALKARRDPDDGAVQAFPEIREAAKYLRGELRAGDLVMVKGSHHADHLTRLILDRARPVQCWDDRCRRGALCETCPKLYAAPQEAAVVAAPAPHAPPAPLAAREGAVPVVVGIGNPGDRTHRTPHNIGQRVLERMVARAGGGWETQPEGLVAKVELSGVPVMLFKPASGVNRSGVPVRAFLERVGGDADHCVLVHDDMDLDIGEVRTKRDGGDAGHKGVRSIVFNLGTGALHRVRIGVRRAGDARKARDIVLRAFEPEDDVALEPAVERALALIEASILANAPHPAGRRDDRLVEVEDEAAASS